MIPINISLSDDTVDAGGPKVGEVDLNAVKNANTCNCEDFELLVKSQNTCILRRSSEYVMKVKVSGGWDTINFIFQFGECVYCISNTENPKYI